MRQQGIERDGAARRRAVGRRVGFALAALVASLSFAFSAVADVREGEYDSVAECFSAREGLANCIDAFRAQAPRQDPAANGEGEQIDNPSVDAEDTSYVGTPGLGLAGGGS